MIKYRMFQGYNHSDEYKAAVIWVENTDGVTLDISGGCSYINGHTYYSYIDFEDEETAILFKLKYPSLEITRFLKVSSFD